jgi:molybdate-binding protein
VERLPGLEVKSVSVGSWAGWEAVKRGEADIAGTHLLDESTMEYNVPFLRRAGPSSSGATPAESAWWWQGGTPSISAPSRTC